MLELRQFRPALYVLLAIGMTGFALAAESPQLWFLSLAALTLNAVLIKTGRFKPLPRLTAAAVTLLALFYAIHELRSGEIVPLLTVGDFLVLLQVVKLFEQRSNRDYAQLLVLSLLLMTAAAISTASLIFGLLMMVYLLVSLYCSLLFHLKVDSDAARAQMARTAPPGLRLPEPVSPAAMRADQRRLSGSMRLLTTMISIVSLGMGVVVFVFFPRGTEEVFGRRLLTPPQAVTGFSDQMSLDEVAKIDQNDQVVAAVTVTHNGQPWGGTEPLLLRCMTLDQYTGEGNARLHPWQWLRSYENEAREILVFSGEYTALTNQDPTSTDTYEQDIELQPSSSPALPAMAGAYAVQLKGGRDTHMEFWRATGELSGPPGELLGEGGTLGYRIRSSGVLPDAISAGTVHSEIDPLVRGYARNPSVSGVDSAGRSLAALRGTPDAPPDIDHRIAEAITKHLKSNFQYTLDLTPDRDLIQGHDPIVAFLYTVKRGHCEYFAGAMTLLCQSLGMEARVVLGYRCDVYNNVGHLYIVSASQAHAWVEVHTDQGWETFDPTSSNEVVASDSEGWGWFGKLKSLFNYLQFEWGASVVAYGRENRDNIVNALDRTITKTAVRSSQSLHGVPAILDKVSRVLDDPTPISAVAMCMIAAMVCLIGYYAYEKLRLRRRAWRIGLWSLPNRQRQRLARQLGFYDDLLRLLERRGLTPRPNWTPLEFSQALSFLPNQAYNDIRRLTQLFYRVRYGRKELALRRRQRLSAAIDRVELLLRQAGM
jgi:protein-glutamine gamma-glutamyltransferase